MHLALRRFSKAVVAVVEVVVEAAALAAVAQQDKSPVRVLTYSMHRTINALRITTSLLTAATAPTDQAAHRGPLCSMPTR